MRKSGLRHIFVALIDGSTIRGWRKARGLEAQFVANAAGLNKQQFSDIERGKRQIEVNEFVAIMGAMGYKPGDVLENSGGVRDDLKPIVGDLERLRPAALLHARDLLRVADAIAGEAAPTPSNVVPFPQPERTVPRWTEEFPVSPESFVEKDFDYPLELHALEVEESEFAAGGTGIVSEIDMAAYTLNAKDVRDATHRVIKVNGDSMSPQFEDGWKLLIDTRKTQPQRGDVVAVYLLDAENEGGIIGYWEPTKNGAQIEKANPRYKPVKLGDPTSWKIVGTVQKVVDAPVKRRKR